MKDFSNTNYDLKPYYVERIFGFIYGLYYEETLLRRGFYKKMSFLEESLNGAFLNGVAVAVSVGEKDLHKYNLKPYRTKSILIFYEGLYYEDHLLYWGGMTAMMDFKNWMNGAYINGVCHAIVVNS